MDRPQMIGMFFALAAAVVGSVGLLQTERRSPSERLGAMAGMDSDGDGRISTDEWSRAGRDAAALRQLDKDANGFLEPAEVKPRRGSGGKG